VIDSRARKLSWAAVLGWAVALAALLLWPITRSGYLLGHDMVFTPRQPLNLASLGVSSASPRAVPVDALVALAERFVDGAVVGRLALIIPVLAAGIGAAALLRSSSVAARLATCGVAIWNPFVVERLALGQWALIWAYAALPWVVLAVGRGQGRGGWLARAGAVAAASITPTGGLIAAATAITVAAGLRRPRREVAAVAGLVGVLQLPWLVPALVSTAATTSDPAAAAAFSARAEHAGGTLLSLVDGGGIWDAEVVPGSRSGAWPWLWLAVLVASAIYGARPLVERLGRRLVLTLTLLAGAGLLLAVLASVPGGDAVVRTAIVDVPGAGLLRDAQKWVLPLVLLEALLVGAALGRVWDQVRQFPWRAVVIVAALAMPVIVLPDAAATLRPTLEPIRYPGDWAAVASRLTRGDAAVVPWGSYRTFAWAPGRSVLDPAPRLLPVTTVVDDRLAVSGQLLRGEDARAAGVGSALRGGPALADRLARLGIRWVVVEHGTPGTVPDLSDLRMVFAGKDVSLYAVPGPVAAVRPASARAALVVVGDGLAALTLLALAGWALGAAVRRRPDATKDLSAARGPLLG
jgi:hypothetical protein